MTKYTKKREKWVKEFDEKFKFPAIGREIEAASTHPTQFSVKSFIQRMRDESYKEGAFDFFKMLVEGNVLKEGLEKLKKGKK